ncbi:hypothetical protein TNCV_4053581 [Trichonephila clavipes]|nr:hypothetical protein TNCV_4053581 [Trichonephila clavipes]
MSRLKRPPIGVEVRRGGAGSGVILFPGLWFLITRSIDKSPRVVEKCDVNIESLTICPFVNLMVIASIDAVM